MDYNVFIINAFTDKLFTGNPAAVCLLKAPKDEEWMRHITRELNQPVTAFVWPLEDDKHGVRWFSQTTELQHCGHGTLSSAYVLFDELRWKDENINFLTRYSGSFIARRTEQGIQLNFPAFYPEDSEAPQVLKDALGVRLISVRKNRLGYLVELENAEAVRNLQPDIRLLGSLPIKGVIVTAGSDTSSYDFVSRYFAPSIGIDEDPVTGSAHCALAPYWAAKLGKNSLVGHQVSKRGGSIWVEMREDRVLFTGQAVTICRGHLSSSIAEL